LSNEKQGTRRDTEETTRDDSEPLTHSLSPALDTGSSSGCSFLESRSACVQQGALFMSYTKSCASVDHRRKLLVQVLVHGEKLRDDLSNLGLTPVHTSYLHLVRRDDSQHHSPDLDMVAVDLHVFNPG
jgi:hypothetical protein